MIQPRSQAFAVATLDLVRRENFKLPNFRHLCRFPEILGKLWENSENGVGVFTSNFDSETVSYNGSESRTAGARTKSAGRGAILPINGKGLGSVLAQKFSLGQMPS